MRPEPEAQTPEQAFAAFRRDGDVRALAAAFDATAPELLRVAAFLVPRDDVEDLLHDTFGVAMARGAAYDESRPLLPWLLGILANEARTLRRRARRQRRDRDEHPPATERDPAMVASDRETEAAFAAALQQLGRDDAALLRQHLVDDLSCREIAERAHEPAGTVRTRVARAMSELRRRLPVGLAVAPGFGDIAPCTLANVRTRVLAGAPLLPVAGGIWWRLRWLGVGVGAAAAIVLVVVFAASTGVRPGGPATVARVEPTRPAHGGEAPTGTAIAAPAPMPERTAVVAAPPAWWLRGSVRSADGTAIPGALVRLHLVEMGPLLGETHSDADGGYRLSLDYWRDRPPLDRRSYGLAVVAEAPGHNSYTYLDRLPTSTAADGSLDLTHDFVLQDYVTLSGRCVDSRGQPVAASVNAFGLRPDRPLEAIATADAQGAFRMVFVGQPERMQIDARDPVAGRRRLEVDLPATGERDIGDIVLEPGYAVRGRVALTDGTAVPGCGVFVRGGLTTEGGLPQVGPEYWYFDTCTGADGRFDASRPRLEGWSVTVRGPLGFPEGSGVGEHWLPATADTADIVLDGVRVDLTWRDVEGRELLPQATRVVVFGAEAGDAAAAARGGDPDAMRLALADESRREPHLVVPRGAHLWIQVPGADGCGVDELRQAPMRNGSIGVELRLVATASTALTVRVRFADGSVPDHFTCRVDPLPGASLRGFEELGRGPGEVRGCCAVGPIAIHVAGYPERFDEVVESRSLVAAAGRNNEVDIVLARRGRIRFVLQDVTAPDRRGDDGPEGDVTIGSVRAGRFFWQSDEMEYWGSPPFGHPVESMAMVPVGRHEVRFEFEGYQPVTRAFDVTEHAAEVVTIWLQPR
jgi:RNA polymerase sigma-70 factor (ECF subfamily)